MDNGMSLSDIAAVTRDNDGWGNGGAWWIIILFLFAFMGNGWGMNRSSDYGQYATAASQQEILCGRRHRAGRLDDAPLWLQHPSGRQRDYTVWAGLLPCQCQRDSRTHGCRYGQPDRTEGWRRHHRRYGSSDGRSKRRGKPHYYGYCA